MLLLQPLLLAAVMMGASATRPPLRSPAHHHQLQCWSEAHLNFMNPGHDLAAVKASTVQACCAACARHHNQSTRVGAGAGAGAGCRFWTFEAPCRPGDTKCFNCVLKRTDAGRRSYAGTISGGLGLAPPPPPLPPGGSGYVPAPVIHFTPPCYDRKGGWHDTAGALLHPITRIWHIFVGPVWQHLSTADLVNWKVVGTQGGMGGSGTLIYDHQRNLTVAVTGTVSAFTTDSVDLLNFSKGETIFKTKDPNAPQMGCWDPVIWWDERAQLYFAMGACGHNAPSRPHEAGIGGTGGYGLQQYFCSPKISGAGAAWKQIPTPFLEWHTESVPRVGTWNRSHEFVTPDFFRLGGTDSYVFLTTSYGGLRQTMLNTTPATGMREYDYSNYFVGTRPAPGGAFLPDTAKSGPFDWSPFQPSADPHSDNLTFATSKGMEQFGCCPKTAGDKTRRVLFGWINNGWDQGPGEPDRTSQSYSNNTLSLPRDLYLSPNRQHLQQRFVAELATLRRKHTHVSQPIVGGGISRAFFVSGAQGLQLEIWATFSCTAAVTKGGKFGLMVLAAADKSEYTAIVFDSVRGHFLLDRTHSGRKTDADVRGGPWPMDNPPTRRVSVHAYVDHAVVEMIANASANASTTAIAAWVSPTSASSNKVAVFSEVPGVVLESLDVWQLESPSHDEFGSLAHPGIKTDDESPRWQPVGGSSAQVLSKRDVMIWTSCDEATMSQLAQHRHSFTKLSPFNAGVGEHPDGSIGIVSSTDNVTNLQSCAEIIHRTFRGTRQYWPCVGAGPGVDRLMPRLFADPSRFIRDAIELSSKLNISGWNLDFEATGEAPNVDHATWLQVLRFYSTFAAALRDHGIETTADVMCTANVTSPSLCKNGLPYYNDSATAEMISLMRASAVSRWVSMGTYGLDQPTTVNQIDWWVRLIGADRYGLGTALAQAIGDDKPNDSDLLLRFSLANAYGVAEIDLFDYEPHACDPHPCNLSHSAAPYFSFLERFLHFGTPHFPAGQAWPYGVVTRHQVGTDSSVRNVRAKTDDSLGHAAQKYGGFNLVSGLWAGTNCSYNRPPLPHDWNCTGHPSNVSFGSKDDIDAVAHYHKEMGANSVALTLNAFVANTGSTGPIYTKPWSPTISQLRAQIVAAKTMGMTVMLRPLIAAEFPDPSDKFGNKSSAHDIGFNFSATQWDEYTQNYIAWHVPYVKLAQDLNVEIFCIGVESWRQDRGSKKKNPHAAANMRKIASAARQLYSGKLVYSANYGAATTIDWWDAVDFIGIDAYYPLTVPNKTPASCTWPGQRGVAAPSVTELVAAYRPIVDQVANLSASVGRPVLFTEVGYRSCPGSQACPGANCPPTSGSAQQQANMVEALFKSWWHLPFFAGFHWWGVDSLPDKRFDPTNFDPKPPAQAIFKQYLG